MDIFQEHEEELKLIDSNVHSEKDLFFDKKDKNNNDACIMTQIFTGFKRRKRPSDTRRTTRISKRIYRRTMPTAMLTMFLKEATDFKKNAWTKEEDDILKNALRERSSMIGYRGKQLCPFAWKEISKKVFNGLKTPNQCRQHYERVIRPFVKKGRWTEEENWKLLELIKMHGARDFAKISTEMENTRTNDQCRKRWINIKKMLADRLCKCIDDITIDMIMDAVKKK
jgi:hypothetical protein